MAVSDVGVVRYFIPHASGRVRLLSLGMMMRRGAEMLCRQFMVIVFSHFDFPLGS